MARKHGKFDKVSLLVSLLVLKVKLQINQWPLSLEKLNLRGNLDWRCWMSQNEHFWTASLLWTRELERPREYRMAIFKQVDHFKLNRLNNNHCTCTVTHLRLPLAMNLSSYHPLNNAPKLGNIQIEFMDQTMLHSPGNWFKQWGEINLWGNRELQLSLGSVGWYHWGDPVFLLLKSKHIPWSIIWSTY